MTYFHSSLLPPLSTVATRRSHERQECTKTLLPTFSRDIKSLVERSIMRAEYQLLAEVFMSLQALLHEDSVLIPQKPPDGCLAPQSWSTGRSSSVWAKIAMTFEMRCVAVSKFNVSRSYCCIAKIPSSPPL